MRNHYVLAILLGAGLALLISLPSPADEAPSKEKIDKLIEQLGSGSFRERENATKELAAIGVPALQALRQAIKSDDAEIRKRAEELLPQIVRQAESKRVLTPQRVRLVYQDTPLPKAVADFQKQSGYTIHLHDPDGKLQERKITLDTGKTTFWHALELFCQKAELSEASMKDLMQVPPGVGGPLAAPVVPHPGLFGTNGQILLKAGKAEKQPTDDGSAVRIRVPRQSDQSGKAPEGEIILPLEVTPEPKLQWQIFESVHIDKAVDDRDQKLAQVIPQVEGAAGFGVGRGPVLGGPRQIALRGAAFPLPGMMGGSANQQVPVQLKKGAKTAKSLKELKGVLTAQLLTEARPLIVADKLKAGETVEGKEGGFIKIVDVKTEEKQTTIRLQFEQPPFDKVVPARQNGLPGFRGGGAPVRIPPRRGGKNKLPAQAAPPPAAPLPAAVQVQIAINGGGLRPSVASFNGLSVRDDRDKALPIRYRVEQRLRQVAGGGFQQTTTYTFTCRHEKDKGRPAKVVFRGRKRATVDIPFVLKDVPLP